MTIVFKISLVLGGLNTLAAACDNNRTGVERVHQQHALPHLERILVSGPSLGTRSDYHLGEYRKSEEAHFFRLTSSLVRPIPQPQLSLDPFSLSLYQSSHCVGDTAFQCR
jgi:hypothetical protein